MKYAIALASVWFLFSTTALAADPKVFFADSFDAKLGDGWAWLRENPQAWRIRDGGLEIRVEPGMANNVKNALAAAACALAAGAPLESIAAGLTSFEPVKGSWGRKGWTQLLLAHAQPAIVRDALALAWRNVAPKKLAATLLPSTD